MSRKRLDVALKIRPSLPPPPSFFLSFFFFFRFLSNVFSDFGLVGRKRSLEIGSPVPQHNIRGACRKQQGVDENKQG